MSKGVKSVSSKVIIFGAKEFEKRLKYYIETYSNDKVAAFCVDREYIENDRFCEVPVVAFDEIEEKYPPETYVALVGIGYKNMNSIRAQKTGELQKKHYKLYDFIHPTAAVDPSVILGGGNIVLSNVTIEYNSRIGCGNIFESGTVISHECQVGDFNYFSPGVISGGKVLIGDNCFFGLNATIRSAIKVESYAFAGAGSYLNDNTEKYEVVVPCRNIKLSKKSTEINILYTEKRKI